jgi:hypothetical protein
MNFTIRTLATLVHPCSTRWDRMLKGGILRQVKWLEQGKGGRQRVITWRERNDAGNLGACALELVIGDITPQTGDAIVNAANRLSPVAWTAPSIAAAVRPSWWKRNGTLRRAA